MTLGKRLAALRQAKGLTQTALAEITFISRSRLALYETDKREPDLQALKQLANFYGVSIDFLLDNNPSQENNKLTQEAFELYIRLQNIPPENRRAIEILLGIDPKHGANSLTEKVV